MTDTILEQLRTWLPRIKLDLSSIDNRYVRSGKQKPKKDEPKDDSSRLSVQAEEYLRDILDDPDVPVTSRGDRLGYTSHMTNKIKNELIGKGLVRQYEVNLGRVNKLLEITEAGCAYLKIEMPKQQGKGSAEHRYWQRRLLSHFHNSMGLKAKIEEHRKEKFVDVAVIEGDGKFLAVEVALTPKNEMRNIKEDLAVGFNKVLVACRNKKVKEEVERRIEKSLDDEERGKAETCLLTDFL